MLKNEVNFKALTFLSEQTSSTFSYEVKGVRAVWDPSLSIPGTNRRGGWRCPVGTRYGGQITDRFGRSCGWGVARRIANQIADIGERLENIDDRKRNDRLARRNARVQRMLARQNKPGFLERGARNIAEALEGGQAPQQARPRIPVQRQRPRIPVQSSANPRTATPRRQLGGMLDENGRVMPVGGSRRQGNLRESEQRRMERELVEPGAPRTGEPPRPNAPRRRRRTAAQQGAQRTARRKPEADFVDSAKPEPTKVPRRKPAPKPPEQQKPSTPIPDPPAWNPTADELGGSVPDAASIRNVRNRFGDLRGLPEDAYWRKPDFPEGEERAELERRFGRYYGDNNKRNARGNFVNQQIFAQQAGAPQPAPPAPAPKAPEPKAPARPAGPPPIPARDINPRREFDEDRDRRVVQAVEEQVKRYKPNAYNNLRNLSKEEVLGKKIQDQQLLKQAQAGFDEAFKDWQSKKNGNERARDEARDNLLRMWAQKENLKEGVSAAELRITEIDAGIEFRQRPPAAGGNNNVPVIQNAPRAQPPARPTEPSAPDAEEAIPDDKIVPDADAGRRSPRKIGREQMLNEAIKQLHEDGGNLADVQDGIVIDAVVDGQFKDGNLQRGREYTDAEVAGFIRNGFKDFERGAKFENRRYKFELVKQSNAGADVWCVLKVVDKNTGEKWFMKSSTYGANDGLLENVGMRAAQALEFGNDENHLRLGNVIANDPIAGRLVQPRRWIMMRDIHQWENGVQGEWKDAKDGLDVVATKINPRDVGRIAVLDMVLDNRDRHGGNFMWVEAGGRVRLGVIDHGLLGGGRRDGVPVDEIPQHLERWANDVVANPGVREYRDQFNNGVTGLKRAGYKIQNPRDRRILKETMRRSVAKMKEDLDTILGVDRIQANGAQLSDIEKAHIQALKRVAEARISWIENNLDDMVDQFI
jgi:hypothetical protein